MRESTVHASVESPILLILQTSCLFCIIIRVNDHKRVTISLYPVASASAPAVYLC